MENIINIPEHTLRVDTRFVGMTLAMLVFSILGIPSAHAAITSTLDIGDRGSEVTELQTYLATNASIYPEGLITGYFGQLTKAAVERFQTTQGIVSNGTPATTGYGRVGPRTMLMINSLLGSGSGNQSYADTSPNLSTPVIQRSKTTATFSWTTNEATQGQIYWDSVPLQFHEATVSHQQPYVSGNLVLDSGGLQTSHSVTVSNLQANTMYYYIIRGIDSAGNMSMIWPSTFRTNQ